MIRILAATVLAIVISGPAMARTPVYARVKCVGLYCMIVSEPDPAPEPVPADWKKGWKPR